MAQIDSGTADSLHRSVRPVSCILADIRDRELRAAWKRGDRITFSQSHWDDTTPRSGGVACIFNGLIYVNGDDGVRYHIVPGHFPVGDMV